MSLYRIRTPHLCLAALLAFASMGHAATIDFSGLPSLTAISNQFPGVIFSLQGLPESGGPPVTYDFGIGMGLTNTISGNYPTANILSLDFAVPVGSLSFTFTNYGTGAPTTYTAYDSGHNVIDTGSLQYVGSVAGFYFELVTVNGSGIAELQINNNQDNSNWEYAIQQVDFTAQDVPEPASLSLAGSALAGLIALRLCRRSVA